jgi:hypothetical protein
VLELEGIAGGEVGDGQDVDEKLGSHAVVSGIGFA